MSDRGSKPSVLGLIVCVAACCVSYGLWRVMRWARRKPARPTASAFGPQTPPPPRWRLVPLDAAPHAGVDNTVERRRRLLRDHVIGTLNQWDRATGHDLAVREMRGWIGCFEHGHGLCIDAGTQAAEIPDVQALREYLMSLWPGLDIEANEEFADAYRRALPGRAHAVPKPEEPRLAREPGEAVPTVAARLAGRTSDIRRSVATRPDLHGPRLFEFLPTDSPAIGDGPSLTAVEWEALLDGWHNGPGRADAMTALRGWLHVIEHGGSVYIRRPFETVRIFSREGLRRYILARHTLDIDQVDGLFQGGMSR